MREVAEPAGWSMLWKILMKYPSFSVWKERNNTVFLYLEIRC